MGKGQCSKIASKLRQTASNMKSRIIADPLFIGTSCAIALVSYTHYTPTLAQTAPDVLSFSDVACLFGVFASLVLLILSYRNHPVFARPCVIWIASACVLVSILSVALFPELRGSWLVTVVGGGLFGIYLSIIVVCWLWVYAHNSAAIVIWNAMVSALVGAIILWFIVGMDTVRISCSLVALLGISAATLTKRMNSLRGVYLDQAASDVERHTPGYIIVATFLFSYAFMVSLFFAGLEHFSSALSAIAILIPFLLVSVFMLSLKRLTTMSLLNIAAPIIVTATLTASFLDFNPIITYDLALVGMLLFLAYAVVLLCAITEKTDSHAYRAFSLFMIGYFGGCIVGRALSAAAIFGSALSHDVVVILSVLAVFAAMLLCIRNGFTPKQLVSLFDPDHVDNENGLTDTQAAHVAKVVLQCNLGNREQEVLQLLLQQKTANEIASEMTIANGTAKSHIRHVYKKLGIHSREELFEMFEL
ncbi:LuxR family transcriptional regulator [Eggerthella sp. YY7918]|uniref:LuxR family transcriptional regulator n=1 Tax=Eggerthella sp. (strain YY7918) TaxID=502558 RepID=UPI0002171188|nr:LuxR family transcriptional regulator [Eggerthella sp. YY7918]BAK45224.1 DNA-binding HTH domain-containing protein [Eggerthella sp. YY7918]